MERDLTKEKMVSYFRDIAQVTGRKYLREVSKLSRIIAKARKTEEVLDRYRVLVESFSDAIFMLDKDRRIISCNRAFRSLFQRTEEEIEKRTLRIITKNDDEYDRITTIIDDIIIGNNTYVFPWEFVRKDGSVLTMEVTVSQVRTLLSEDAAPVGGCVAILHDITDRIEQEDALRAAEEKYRNIFQNAAEGIFQVAVDGHYISANPALARIFGFASPLQMTGNENLKAKKTFVKPEDYRRLNAILRTRGLVENFESERYRTDGTKMWTSTNVRLVTDRKNGSRYFEGTVRDITPRKNLESQLRHSQKMEAIGTLAGGVAHDFNNLLTALIGYGNLLQIKMEKDNPLRVYVDHILSSAKRAANLTNSLLAFSRKQAVNLEPNGINEIITGVQKLLERLLSEDIELRVQIPAREITIMADRTQIEQILMNLATNARDAMTETRILTISTGQASIDRAFINKHGYGRIGAYARLTVTDTGHGMDEKVKEHIFEPFFTTKEAGRGTGLGLSTVYGIVKQHDGYVTVESEPGKGTTFQLYFPSVRVKREKARHVEPKMPTGTETILVAEDDRETRQLMKEILQEYGYTVIGAADGDEAVRYFVEHRQSIGLVIIDVIMPKKNGMEVYSEISKVDPSVKVLFVSGHARDVVVDKGVVDSRSNFLSKPIAPSLLLERLRTILDAEMHGSP
ncbi:MAG: PAS domain S-box protein [Syntrophorhabdaceae bacterium]|nr:PAS domain S-box protein [Syntrophorhabdaceae bacterium]